jgi:hypothetical protein
MHVERTPNVMLSLAPFQPRNTNKAHDARHGFPAQTFAGDQPPGPLFHKP